MPAPLDPDLRQAILDDIRAGAKSRNAIAADHGVSRATVTNIAKAAGVVDAFDRTHAQKGARARAFDAKAARVRAIEDLYGDFQRFRGRVWDEYTQVITGPAGPELVTTLMPPLRDQQAGMTAAAICLDKAIALEKHDSDEGSGVGKTMINDLFAALRLPYAQAVESDAAEHGASAAEEGADGAPDT